MKLVYIEWIDSYGCSSDWNNLENCKPELLLCRSVGWLLHADKTCKVIVPHITQDQHDNIAQQGCGEMTIPTKAVRKIVFLTIPSNERKKYEEDRV